MESKGETRVKLLKEVMEGRGPFPLYAIDNGLVKHLADIIGILYRELQSRGLTDYDIEARVERSNEE